MVEIDAEGLDYSQLNERLRETEDNVTIKNCCGQRFIGAGFTSRAITVYGIAGNAAGAYLNGAQIILRSNAQDALGDTMNDGKIVVHGNIGDAAGYAMRGGEIYVKGNAGYRAGIHMKEYKEKRPAIVIGGKCGSFLGEYQAGGIIIVLGLTEGDKKIVGNFPFTGMHGGRVFLRSAGENIDFPEGVVVSSATDDDMEDIKGYIAEFCLQFGVDEKAVLDSAFIKIEPDSKNPYKQMYVAN